TLKVLQPEDAVAKRARNDVLNAEFRFQRRLRVRSVGVAQAPAMRHHLDTADIRGCNLVVAPQLECHGNRGMRAAATGKLLERNRFGLDLPRRSKILKQFSDVEGAGPVEDVEEALLMLERVGRGINPSLGQKGSEQAVAAALADMKRLRHGAEIGLQPACERGRDAQRHRRSGLIELHEMTGGCRGTKDAQRCGWMPTLVVVMKIDGARQPDLD